jgi:hypothetical protein
MRGDGRPAGETAGTVIGDEEKRKYNFRRKDGTKRHYKRMGRIWKRDGRETVDGTGGR